MLLKPNKKKDRPRKKIRHDDFKTTKIRLVFVSHSRNITTSLTTHLALKSFVTYQCKTYNSLRKVLKVFILKINYQYL